MKRDELPPLALRTTRIRLLASTLLDAQEPDQHHGRADQHGSRLLLHGRLWHQGSYAALQHAMSHLEPRDQRVFRERFVYTPFGEQRDKTHTRILHAVEVRMPRAIHVPIGVTCNAGYLEQEAMAYATAHELAQHRRDQYRPPTLQQSPQAVTARPHPASD